MISTGNSGLSSNRLDGLTPGVFSGLSNLISMFEITAIMYKSLNIQMFSLGI